MEMTPERHAKLEVQAQANGFSRSGRNRRLVAKAEAGQGA
jgi:hypothetical protein